MADRVLVIDVDQETQIERTVNRDKVSKQQVLSILKSQADRMQRLQYADDVLENNSGNELLLPQIKQLHQKYLAMSGENR